MARTTRRRKYAWVTSLFYFFLTLTVFVYVLRGFALLSMMPGGILWVLLLLTIAIGVLAILLNTR
jgi:hypothetical protein